MKWFSWGLNPGGLLNKNNKTYQNIHSAGENIHSAVNASTGQIMTHWGGGIISIKATKG